MYDAETDISMFVSAFYCLKKRGGESKAVFCRKADPAAGKCTDRRGQSVDGGGIARKAGLAGWDSEWYT